MELSTIIAVLIQGLFGCAMAFFILRFFRQKQIDQQKEDVKKLEAKMSSYRMLLKAKVKKKAQFYRASMPQAIRQGDPIDNVVTQLTDLNFDSGEEFQKYFDSSKQLNNFLRMGIEKAKATQEAKLDPTGQANLQKPPQSVENVIDTNSEFMTTDIKNEFTIIKIMNELIDLNLKIKSKIETYNSANFRNQLPVPKPITFNSLHELKKIFTSQPQPTNESKIAS